MFTVRLGLQPLLLAGLGLCILSCAGCSDPGASVQGEIIDIVTGKPLQRVPVKAETPTDIKEEMRRANISSKTDRNGNFVISGLLPERRYTLSGLGDHYFFRPTTFNSPEAGLTRILEPSIGGLMLLSNTQESHELVGVQSSWSFPSSEKELALTELSSIFADSKSYLIFETGSKELVFFVLNADDVPLPFLTAKEWLLEHGAVELGTGSIKTSVPLLEPPENGYLYRFLPNQQDAHDLRNEVGIALVNSGSKRALFLTATEPDADASLILICDVALSRDNSRVVDSLLSAQDIRVIAPQESH